MVNTDLKSGLLSILNVVRSSSLFAPCTSPCDCLALKMHYRWTFCMFVACLYVSWHGWYHGSTITCSSHHSVKTTVRMDFINICLSYPFLETNGIKRYILYYRWLPYVLMLCAGLYYIPRKLSKMLENKRLKCLMESLARSELISAKNEQDNYHKVVSFLNDNLFTFNGLYYKFILVNMSAICVNCFVGIFINYILDYRFMKLGYEAFPYTRDPDNYTDYISITFPPFAKCIIDANNQLVLRRSESFGCHLCLMELYEKVFLILWWWLWILLIISILFLAFYISFMCPCIRRSILKPAKPRNSEKKVNTLVTKVSNICKVGDIYVLYRIKEHISHPSFYNLLLNLSNDDDKMEDFKKKDDEEDVIKEPPPKAPPANPRKRTIITGFKNRKGNPKELYSSNIAMVNSKEQQLTPKPAVTDENLTNQQSTVVNIDNY